MVAAAGLALASAGAAAEDLPGTETLARSFEEVVFSSEIAGVAPPQSLRKWTGPIRLKFGGPGAAGHETDIRRNAAELGALTGLAFEFLAPNEPKENFVVLFAPQAGMVEAGKRFLKDEAMVKRIVADSRGGCFFLSFHKAGVLIYAAIVVNAERPADEIAHCLLEEMTQALGLPGDSDAIGPSIFNQTRYRSTLTAADRILIRALYDPRMAPGLPRTEAMARVRGVIQELR
ncbi:MAG: DUF2927 domain-containing protein [Rhodospirillaceae bacterium]|nr:DUF2927 domain-containing protein [Rhodospirillaceae bacterium]MBT6119824.1 DUF2927 domain-containing protein [Rhodospirillaceae bacterium]